MGIRLDGKPVANQLKEDLKVRIQTLKDQGQYPTLRIIRVGERGDDISYEKSLIKHCGNLEMNCEVKQIPADCTQADLEAAIIEANEDAKVHGILLFRPLPEQLDLEKIRIMIDPVKDVDCMNPINIGNMLSEEKGGIAPCTSKACMELLRYYEVPLEGADVTVIGASLVVGRPLGLLLTAENATVSLCHVYTKDVASYSTKSEIVISACGVPKLWGPKFFNENAIVVDVGINFDKEGKLCGDVDFDNVVDNVKAITPTAGGIGVITTTILLGHVVSACEKMAK